MAIDLGKFSGVWAKDKTEGDITDWLKAQNVGFLARQAAWGFGYGKGLQQRTLIEDGVCYEEQVVALDKVGYFPVGGRIKLDGSRQKITFFEGAPLIPPKSMLVEGRVTDTGMEFTMFHLSGELHSSSVRSISEDGSELTTEVTAHVNGKELKMNMTHKKTDDAVPVVEDMLSACMVSVFVDAIPEDSQYKNSAISDSLEEYFASAGQCWEALVAWQKAKKLGDTEKEISWEEVSDAEFIAHITNKDDSKASLVHKVDKDACTSTASYTMGDTVIVAFDFHVRSDPIRLEVSNSWTTDEHRLYDSYLWVQRVLKEILPRSK